MLAQCTAIIEAHRIMLSEKKMLIGQPKIEFLRTKLYDGLYKALSHMAQEFLKLSDTDLMKAQIQQFLGIINYLRDFIPYLFTLTSPLNKMLRKDPPSPLIVDPRPDRSCQKVEKDNAIPTTSSYSFRWEKNPPDRCK